MKTVDQSFQFNDQLDDVVNSLETKKLGCIYENQLKPILESFEEERKSLMVKSIAFIVMATLGFCLIAPNLLLWFNVYSINRMEKTFNISTSLINSYISNSFLFCLVGIGLFVVATIFNWLIKFQKKSYKKTFKENIVKKIVNIINSTWYYSPEGMISSTQYYASSLFDKKVDKYEGDDLVIGQIKKTEFCLSELHTQSRYKNYYYTIFKGLFAHIDFNKEIKGKTFVFPEQTIFNKPIQNFNFFRSKGQLIKLENPEFEKLFIVYGTSQIEARYILTPAIMEAMVKIRKKYKTNISFSFIGNYVYIALSIKEDLFEPRIFKSGISFNDVEQMDDQFRLINIIINEMNLNTRVWSKE